MKNNRIYTMDSLLGCDAYVISDIFKLLPYNNITLLRSIGKRLNDTVNIFLQQQTKICGCWQCVQDFINENPNINVKEINLRNENDELEYGETYNFCFPDTIEKIYVEDETDAHVVMPLPKQLKVFHTGGIWDDGKINCPNLEEFLCCNTGASPPPYEFEQNTTKNLKTFVMDRCGDNGEDPMEFIYNSPLEKLMLSTATDKTLMNLNKLKYLECNKLDGSCFKNLHDLEYLAFHPKKTFDASQFTHLTKLKVLDINKYIKDGADYDILSQLQYVSPTLEYLGISGSIIRNMSMPKLLELAEFMTTRFTQLKEFFTYDSKDKPITFFNRIVELNPKIKISKFMPSFLYNTIVKPCGFFNVCVHSDVVDEK